MIKDLADLRAFLTLCRQKGVAKVTIQGITVEFGELPQPRRRPSEEDQQMEFPTDELTPEQLAFYSVGVQP